MLLHFETQTLLTKGKQASIKFLRGCTGELLIVFLPLSINFQEDTRLLGKFLLCCFNYARFKSTKTHRSQKSMLKLKKNAATQHMAQVTRQE